VPAACGSLQPDDLVYDGQLYVLYDFGLLSAFNARTGEVLYDRQKLPAGLHFTASPWAATGRVFFLNEDGMTFVVRAGDRFELMHTNKLAEDDMCMATPALAGDRPAHPEFGPDLLYQQEAVRGPARFDE